MVLLVGVLAVFAAGCDWPMFGFGPGHTNANPFEASIGVNNVSDLVETWAYFTGSGALFSVPSTPAVVNGVLYVGSSSNSLDAFDAAGLEKCSGSPNLCDPLWTASTGTGTGLGSSPTVANGVVYASSDVGALYAFDAAGVKRCSGTPKTCKPLWTAATGTTFGSPVVDNGIVYAVGSDGSLHAFDASGVTNCKGRPKTCAPLWSTASTPGSFVELSPAVAGGVVYVGSGDHNLYAFDAAGTTSCSGNPKVCSPLWSALGGSALTGNGGLAAANGVVYDVFDSTFSAFDAAGSVGCAGDPKTCTPLWSVALGGLGGGNTPPAVANGVVYLGVKLSQMGRDFTGELLAFDAAGVDHCSGTPTTCTPLWSTSIPVNASPVVVNGIVYENANDNTLHAYHLP